MDHDRPLIKAALWCKLSQGDKGRLKQLSVQYAGNKRRSVNAVGRRTLGVSLEVLAQSGLIGADADDANCSKFVNVCFLLLLLLLCCVLLSVCFFWFSGVPGVVVAFIQTIPELPAKAIAMGEQFDTAAKAGHLNSFGEANTNRILDMFNLLVNGLDVHVVCPFLAREHALPSPDMA
jgi:hypothetical protein